MAAAQEVHGLKMHEARRPDLATIGPVRSVGHEIDAELTLGRLDRGINLALRHVIAFGIELEMMDQSFHRALHHRALRWHHLVVLHRDRSKLGGQSFATLLHDAYRLTHLLHADEIAVVAVALLADRNVEFELVVALVRLRLAQVPRRARAAHHDARKAMRPGFLLGYHANIDVALLEDTVFREQPLDVVTDF